MGRLVIRPTVKLAAMAFGVSVPRVAEGLKFYRSMPSAPATAIGLMWASASEQGARFVRVHLAELWVLIDAATA